MADRDWAARVGGLRDQLEARVAGMAPGARVLGSGAARLANTCCLTMPGVSHQIQLIELDLAGVAVSTGSACSSGKVGPSHVLAAMGVAADEAQTAIRISLGWASTASDVERFVAAWRRLYERTRGRAAA
jgi:cysteine desulfurase